MHVLKWLGIVAFTLLWGWNVVAQSDNRREIIFDSDSLQLTDSLLIYPNSVQVYCDTFPLRPDQWTYEPTRKWLKIIDPCKGMYRLEYRVLPIPQSLVYLKRDTQIVYREYKGDRELFLLPNATNDKDVFGGSALQKSGSISRGLTFGNNQNLGVNSTLNLELSGDVAPNLKLLAVLTDDNLPIQPDGNTNQLREFDQVFVQLYNDQFKLIAGDFWLRKPTGYFMTYQKRGQGLTLENLFQVDSLHSWKTQVSGAFSKGKFNRQIIQGIEGNQGPYRLVGAQNEPFIIVLSGTEQVFIDGKLLERGQEFDYVINYNTAEVTFTSRNFITKDSRIVVEFQYSDQNYARSLLQSSIQYTGPRLKFWLNGYTEQDAKNQPLQQDLSDEQKLLLASIGDSLQDARSTSIDSIGYLDNQVLYAMIDSLGFDSVLVYSVDPSVAVYRAVFSEVGANNGNYVFSNFNALGRVYRWVAPVNGIPQGNFAPVRLLATPKKQQMVSAGAAYRITKRLTLENETALSYQDVNTFSRTDAADNEGFANRFSLIHELPLGDSDKNWKWSNSGSSEYLQSTFIPVQQFRAVEFDRDWNVRNQNYVGDQWFNTVKSEISRPNWGQFNLAAQQYSIGRAFNGQRISTSGNIETRGFFADWTGSFLVSQADVKNQFNRHKVKISQSAGPVRVGYQDDFEENVFGSRMYDLGLNAYRFYDYQFFVENSDSSKFFLKGYYRERYDWLSDSSRLTPTAKATTYGAEWSSKTWQNQNLTLLGNYRQLEILDSILTKQTPENTLLGRIDYGLRAWRGAFTFNNFYEVGSGLELKREFLYIQVNDGQGIYTWIDYNQDGVKDLNEFEVAQFVDQASYIRVFTPSNQYVKTFSTELNQSVFWRPERLWSNKKGVLKVLSYVSAQTRFRTLKKTADIPVNQALDPRSRAVADTQLISTTSQFRQSLFINRTSPVFSSEISYQNNQSKTLLATGFDARADEAVEVLPQLNLWRKILLQVKAKNGNKLVQADYTAGRNYRLNYQDLEPSIAYQPNTFFRCSVNGRYGEKENEPALGGEKTILRQVGTEVKYNQPEKGSFSVGGRMVEMRFSGQENSPLGYEMLEGLRPGINYTWNVSYQRNLSKSMQLSLQYNGRTSTLGRIIHSGGMEIRAFF